MKYIILFGVFIIITAFPACSTLNENETIHNSYNYNKFKPNNIDYSYISREEIIEVAEGYKNHEWYPTEDNIFHGIYAGMVVDTPDRNTYTTQPENWGWTTGEKNIGVPYQWGGFSSIPDFNLTNPKDFNDQYTGAGLYEDLVHFAGDIYTDKNTVCPRACGVDCSGFVSRCWNLPVKHYTRNLEIVAHPIKFEELKPGDILNVPNYHVILFKEFANEEKTEIITIEAGLEEACVYERTYSVIYECLSDFCVSLEDHPITYVFELFRYDYIDGTPIAPSITGPSSGNIRTEYEYIFNATDPDYDDIYYCIDWGDGSEEYLSGPHKSGEELVISHSWTNDGTYMILARTYDTKNSESGWEYLEVTMPKSKSTIIPFEEFFSQNQNIFFLIKFLMEYSYLFKNHIITPNYLD